MGELIPKHSAVYLNVLFRNYLFGLGSVKSVILLRRLLNFLTVTSDKRVPKAGKKIFSTVSVIFFVFEEV